MPIKKNCEGNSVVEIAWTLLCEQTSVKSWITIY